ncbi:MAG: AraC family transcriptional regulator [Ramlibacter sp.]|nr:AraC family transcriptional regulator [Ramlibacter sp.]
MTNVTRSVSTMSIFPLVQCAQEEGIGLPALLAGSTLTEAQLHDPAQRLPFAQELVLVRNYLAHTREAHPGLRASTFYHYNCFGPLGAALVSHPDMLAACRFLVRYVELTFTPFRVLLEEEGEDWRAQYLDRDDLGDCRGFYLLRDLAFIRNLCREASPEGWTTLVGSMDIAMAEPADSATVRDFFQWPLRFDCADTVIHTSRGALRQPLRLANEMTLQMMRQQCETLLAQRQPLSWRERVEGVLQANTGRADPAAIARHLNCSERSLRRHLQQEGCNFLEIVAGQQLQRAMHYLRHSQLHIESIAERLGYSETAAFTHAFKRWMGKSPSEFRSDGAASDPKANSAAL